MRDEATWTRKWLALVLTVTGVALVGCPGEKPVKKRAAERREQRSRAERSRSAPPKPAPVRLDAFSTPDARAYVRVKPQALFGSKAFKQALQELTNLRLFQLGAPPEEILRQELGLDVDQIERIEVAVSRDDGLALAAALFKSAYDKAALIEKINAGEVKGGGGRLIKSGTHKGIDLHRLEGDETMVVAFVSPTVLAFGEPDAIRSGIDNFKAGRAAGVPPEAKELMAAAPAGASLVAAVPSVAGIEGLGALSAAVKLGKEDLSRFKSVALAVTSADAFDVWCCLRAVDADAAEKLREDARAGLEQSKTAPPEALSIPEMAPVKGMIESVKIGGTGSGVEVTARVTPDVIKSVGALVGMLGAQMMAPHPGGGGEFDFDFKADFDD